MTIDLETELLLCICKEKRIQDFIKLNKQNLYGSSLALYNFIKDFFLKYKELPSEKVIKSKFKLSFELVQSPFGFLKSEYQNKVIRETIGSLIVDLGNKVKEDPKKAIDLIKEKLFLIENENTDLMADVRTFDDLAVDILKEIKEYKNKDSITGIPTGWKTLNEITQGYQKGDVYVFVARVKMGKSACILYSSDSANKAGFIPMVISMEMKIKQFARRHLALRTNIGYDFFKSRKLSKFAEKLVELSISNMQKYPPFYYVEGQLKKDISEIATLINFYNPNIVFIDGGYLLDVEHGSKRQRWEELELIMKSIKSIAMKSDIPVVLTFQFKREMLKKKQADVGMEDIRLSDDIPAIASVVIGIFEKSPYEADITEDVVSAKRYLEILGGREGETGGFYINWDWERMNFSEITNENIYEDSLIKRDIPTYTIESSLFDVDS